MPEGDTHAAAPVLAMSTVSRDPGLTAEVKALALAAGFDVVGITSADPFAGLEDLLVQRIQHGYMGGLSWFTTERAQVASDVRQIIPSALSILSLALSYASPLQPEPSTPGRPRGRVARYAWGRDYHRVVKERTVALIEQLRQRYGHREAQRGWSDTQRVVDRAVAQRAGVGWYGSNTCILTKQHGSYVVLAEVVTDLPLVPDRPLRTTCGSCTLCMPACPTGALPQPGLLDVRRCISYWTIEHRGAIDRAMRPLMGAWIFGCDLCQEVCPVNRNVPTSTVTDFAPEHGIGPSPELLPILSLSPEAFSVRFAGTPIKRAKRIGLLRNVCVALGNGGDDTAITPLCGVLESEPDAIIRQHSAWALSRLGSDQAHRAIERAARGDAASEVRDEAVWALEHWQGGRGAVS